MKEIEEELEKKNSKTNFFFKIKWKVFNHYQPEFLQKMISTRIFSIKNSCVIGK